jgi:Ca2+:H+ antiporter
VARKLLWGSLVLAPITFVARYVLHADETLLFVLAAAALIPLAWLIGEATEHAAEHTGPGIGGFLNASFGNAPELIIALFAISSGLPNVVRGSLAGSVVSNILLVLGLAMLIGPDRARLDRRSLVLQLSLVVFAVLLFLVPAVPGFHGDPDRHSLALVTLPVAIVLLGVYVAVTFWNLRQHHAAERKEADVHAWSLKRSLVALAAATAVTALISEILVHSLDAFAHSAGLSEFFISFVIVAIVGNAAEHGGAVVIAHRGNLTLASEIAISSSAQVALFVIPAVALLSFLVTPALPLTFRPIELIAMGGAAAGVAYTVRDGFSRRWEGGLLIAIYGSVALAAFLVGDR